MMKIIFILRKLIQPKPEQRLSAMALDKFTLCQHYAIQILVVGAIAACQIKVTLTTIHLTHQ